MTVTPYTLAKRVLVVVDDRNLSDLLRDILGAWGCEVRTVAHDGEALGAARAFLPEVVICSLGLRRLDVYAVVRGLRAVPALDDLRAIALAALPDHRTRREAREAGFDLCVDVTKPSALSALLLALGCGEAGAGTCTASD